MSKTEKRLSIVSIVLIAVMVSTAVFNVAIGGISLAADGGAGSAVNGSSAANNFEKVNMDLSSLREQYINQSLLQKNIASFDGERWVIVELTGDTLYDKFSSSTRYNEYSDFGKSVEGRKAKANIQAEQQKFLSKLDSHGIDYKFKYSYTGLANAVAIRINADSFNAIKKMNGVSDVYYTENYAVPTVEAVTNNANVYTTGIYDSSDIDYKGDGMVVAVLDTGLDYTHEAFATMPENPALGWDKAYVENKLASAEFNAVGTADDFYYNEKIPFAYDYADDDTDVYPSYSSHGTHVAGIVAGSSDYVVNKETGEKFIGVAPQAQLVIGKVFTDNLDSEGLGGANSMDILAAVEDCALLGVDVINMSLGTAAGFTDERSSTWITEIYALVEAAGISLVVAASNDYSSGFGGGNGTNLASNPDSGTVGSPSTYGFALSVASINGQKSDYLIANDDPNQVAFITESSNEFGIAFEFVDLLYGIAAQTRGVASVARTENLKFKYVVIGDVGRPGNYTSTIKRRLADKTGYDGTIALVKRGDTTFAEKVQAAMDAGADACIIYNNVAGTIRMSLGEVENPIPTCSITMDAGKVFVDNADRRTACGSITVNASEQIAGPFMSDFSSWGPTPDLHLKPEITAHGGEITSAVAGGYDVYSGTSMAAPNMAGAIALLRQHLKGEGLTGKELSARVNQVLMSTATIANNDSGNPYSPRKQGAGLAGIKDAIDSEGYITVNDANGDVSDKTKIELFDDPTKKGVYELRFTMRNTTDKAQTYEPKVYVMTETMSSDMKTVAEKAYILNNDCTIEYKVGGQTHSGTLTVPQNGTVEVEIKITLGAGAKQYLDTNFINGMYVEGFVSMVATGDTKITLGLPYLAFYGDWTDAPLFDYDTYELAESEMDSEIKLENKLKASAAETRIIGMYYNDEYILPLGQYIYEQNEEDVQIYPEREKIAISMFDDTQYGHTIYEIYAVYAGLLRGAAYMNVVITDAATGEVKFVQRQENVNKSYAAGGSNRGAFVPLELNPAEWGLSNNSTYYVSLVGEIDYGHYEDADGEKHGASAGQNKTNVDSEGYRIDASGNRVLDKNGYPILDIRNSFNFQFTADYESPEMLSYKIRYVPYTVNKVVKYRIYMDVEVRDNQYVQDVLPCYIDETRTENKLRLLTEYAIPVYGQKGETSTVSFEITDLYEDYIKNSTEEKQLYLQVEDYALNSTTYVIKLGSKGISAEAKNYPYSVEFAEDELLVKGDTAVDGKGNTYNWYELTLSPYTLYTLNPTVKVLNDAGEPVVSTSTDALFKTLTWTGGGNRVFADNYQLFSNSPAISARTTMTLGDETGKVYARIRVSIKGETVNPLPKPESITFNPVINGKGYVVSLDAVTPELELNPGQTLKLGWTVSPWYCTAPQVIWSSSNPDVVKVDADGVITTIGRGSSYIMVQSKNDSNVVKSVRVKVGSSYRVSNYSLMEFYGHGVANIPNNLNIMYLNEDCFKGRTDITKVILPTTLTEIPENAFQGCTALEEVIIPGKCTVIKENAFDGCRALKTVRLGQFVDSEQNSVGDEYFGTLTVGRHAFRDCVALDTITMYGGTFDAADYYEINSQRRITTLYDEAFLGCVKLGSIDLYEVRVSGSGVFRNCTGLRNVTLSEHTVIGDYMFEGCTSLNNVNYSAESVAPYAFKDCTALTALGLADSVKNIGAGAFYNTKISELALPNGDVTIGADAFAHCANLTSVSLSGKTHISMSTRSPFVGCTQFSAYNLRGASEFYTVTDGILYENGGETLASVPVGHTAFELPVQVTEIADAAYAGVTGIADVDLGRGGIKIGNYAFANSSVETVVLPDGMTAIPEGLFYGCARLASVTANDNFASLTKIGNGAFENCAALTTVSMPEALMIGEEAFMGSGLTALPSAKITEIGMNAFNGTALKNVSLPNLTKLGAAAFANIATLTRVELGAVTSMGSEVFVNSQGITYVSFANGTTAIGEKAFYSENSVSNAIEVVLPNSVTSIGASAFYNQGGLTAVNLSGVEYVYEYAFYKTGITGADLSNIKQIGVCAFEETKLVTADLDKAEFIGEAAFYNVETLTSVTLGAAQIIGYEAFAGTSLTTVEIPATMNRRTYDYSWYEYDEKHRPEPDQFKTRQELAYGAGAFAGISTLTSITVAQGNPVFISIDGVLYSRVENGLVLEQYPNAKAGKSYTVEKNTVVIRDEAFQNVSVLESIEFPYTVNTIGAYAFFNSSVKNYKFNGVEAPVLLANYFDLSLLASDAESKRFLAGNTNFYANFSDFAILADKGAWVVPNDYKLTLTIPLNAKGYDGVWTAFFSTINRTDTIEADRTTHAAIESIASLMAYLADKDIANMSLEQVKKDSALGIMASDARKAYNEISSAEQLALAADSYANLMSVEKAIRDRKAALGAPARIVELQTISLPSKTRYDVGEKFDPTGMSLKVIYDDGSEVPLDGDNYTLSQDTMTYNAETYGSLVIRITFKDDANIYTEISVMVNAPEQDNNDPSGNGDPSANNTGLGKSAVIAISVVIPLVVLLAAGAAVAIVLIKKKKASAIDGGDNGGGNGGNNERGEVDAPSTEVGAMSENAAETPEMKDSDGMSDATSEANAEGADSLEVELIEEKDENNPADEATAELGEEL